LKYTEEFPPLMQILVDAVHTAADCPSSNSKAREMAKALPKQLPAMLTKLRTKILAGPFVGTWNHHTYMILDAPSMKEAQELTLGLAQTNTVNLVPIVSIEEALKAVEGLTPLH